MRRPIALALFAIGVATLGSSQLSAQCTGVNHVTWPAVNPVWDFCWVRPSQTLQPNGEGIRITDVFYKGRKIFKDGGIPVLNVNYSPGGCGCFRDWFDQERAFSCAPSPSSGYCTGTSTPVTTVCNHPGSDAGTFSGVSVVDKGTSLKLTSQAQAGWYRYISTWEFFPDGRIHPGMDITAVNNSCVASTHRHHAYFRFDFDLDANSNNFVDKIGAASSSRVATETTWTDSSSERSQWRLGRTGSSTRVYVRRNAEDGFAAGDTFGKIDGAVLAYSASELNDSSGGCDINLTPYTNGQNVSNADLVMWVHSMVDHIGEPGGISAECFMFGPWVQVRTTPTPSDFNGNGVSDVKLYMNGTWASFPVP